MATKITLGQVLESKITLTVKDEPRDPGSLSLRWSKPGTAGSETIIAVPNPLTPPDPIERLGEGVYRALIPLTSPGDWRIRWETTEPAAAGAEARVDVGTIYAPPPEE